MLTQGMVQSYFSQGLLPGLVSMFPSPLVPRLHAFCLSMCWKVPHVSVCQWPLPLLDRRIWTLRTKVWKPNFHLLSIWVPAEPDVVGRINNACRCSSQRHADNRAWQVDGQACGKKSRQEDVDMKEKRPKLSGGKAWMQVDVPQRQTEHMW